MQRFLAFAISALFSAGIVCSDEPRTPGDLIGHWAPEKTIIEGKLLDLGEQKLHIEFTASQLRLQILGAGVVPVFAFNCFAGCETGMTTLDLRTADKNPWLREAIHALAIYKFEGDTLWICSGHIENPRSESVRPAGFISTPESKTDLIVLRRVGAQ